MVDTKTRNGLREPMAAFFYAYMAFTDKPDEMLAKRGLARVHHRILFFLACRPGMSVSELLQALGVSKQALNTPLRQLIEMGLVQSASAEHDKRVKQLNLSTEGKKLEETLHREQVRLLERAFAEAGEAAVAGWMAVNERLGLKP
ncbi:MAG: MarR family transcriptional regulator [Burkholderiaceae bacterium]|nr:MarR family transcriptional regulator [Burkholderiaceae bacterium]